MFITSNVLIGKNEEALGGFCGDLRPVEDVASLRQKRRQTRCCQAHKRWQEAYHPYWNGKWAVSWPIGIQPQRSDRPTASNPSVTPLGLIFLLTVHEDDASACFRPLSSTLIGLIASRYSFIEPMLSYDRWGGVFSLFFYYIFSVTLAGYTREGSPKSAVDSTIVPTLGVILSWKTVFPLYVTSMGREKSTSLM